MHISRNEPDKLSWQEIDDEIATTSRALIATVEHLSTNPLWRAQIYFRLATAVLEESRFALVDSAQEIMDANQARDDKARPID